MHERVRLIYCAVTREQKRVAFDKHNGLAAVCKDADGLSLLSCGLLLLRSEVNEYCSHPLLCCHEHSSEKTHTHTHSILIGIWVYTVSVVYTPIHTCVSPWITPQIHGTRVITELCGRVTE